MPRPVTLFTGQWADLPFESSRRRRKPVRLRRRRAGLLGRPLRGRQGAQGKDYVQGPLGHPQRARPEVLRDLQPPRRPGGLRPHRRAAQGDPAAGRLGRRRARRRPPAGRRGDDTASRAPTRAARRSASPSSTASPARASGTASTRSRRPTRSTGRSGFDDFAKRWKPILDEFEKQDVNFGLEVHPTEIAFDIASAQRAIEAVKGHKRFGFNYDPSHLGYQGVDYVKFIRTLRRPHLPRAHEGRLVGPRRRHRRRVRRPH